VIKDPELAREAAEVEANQALDPGESRDLMRKRQRGDILHCFGRVAKGIGASRDCRNVGAAGVAGHMDAHAKCTRAA
jgi:hypothetical protein